MRCTCARSTPGSRSAPLSAAASSSSSGMLLQRKNDNRDASSTSLTENAPASVALALDAVQELRAHEQALERELDSRVEAAFGAAQLVERHEVRDVGVDGRPAIRAARERAQDLLGARHFGIRVLGGGSGGRRRFGRGSASRRARSRRTARESSPSRSRAACRGRACGRA